MSTNEHNPDQADVIASQIGESRASVLRALRFIERFPNTSDWSSPEARAFSDAMKAEGNAEAVRAENGAEEVPESFIRALAEVGAFPKPAPQEQPPRQEGETPETDRIEADYKACPDQPIPVRALGLARLLERERNAAERRAADAEAGKRFVTIAMEAVEHELQAAEAERDRLRSMLQLVTDELYESNRSKPAIERISEILSGESFSEPDPADTLPANARFEEVEKPKWLPIESAPKDGTRVLLFDVSPHIGYWFVSKVANKELYPDSWRETGSRHRVDPTHWQPLPAAPAMSAPSAKGGA